MYYHKSVTREPLGFTDHSLGSLLLISVIYLHSISFICVYHLFLLLLACLDKKNCFLYIFCNGLSAFNTAINAYQILMIRDL